EEAPFFAIAGRAYRRTQGHRGPRGPRDFPPHGCRCDIDLGPLDMSPPFSSNGATSSGKTPPAALSENDRRSLLVRNRRRFPRAAGVFWIAALFLAVAGTISAAGDVNLTGANAFKDLDNSDGTPDGVYNVSGSLTLQPGASILCNDSGLPPASACPIS